jgi:drug/metabolite transporter (DMT)-like permease
MYGHLPNWKTLVAICIGVLGVALVEQPHIEAGNLGVFAALAAAAFTSVAMLGLHRLHDIDPRAVVVHFSAVATVFCLGAFFLTPRTEPVARVAEPLVLLQLLGIGISATIGQVFLTLAFGRGAPAKVSVVGLTQIVFVLAMCAIAFDRTVNTVALIGTGLVIAPTAWLLTRSKATSETKPTATDPVEAPALPQPPLAASRHEEQSEDRSSEASLSAPQLRP